MMSMIQPSTVLHAGISLEQLFRRGGALLMWEVVRSKGAEDRVNGVQQIMLMMSSLLSAALFLGNVIVCKVRVSGMLMQTQGRRWNRTQQESKWHLVVGRRSSSRFI